MIPLISYFFLIEQLKLELLIKNLDRQMNYRGGILMVHQLVKLKVQTQISISNQLLSTKIHLRSVKTN
jgi:hypothetical protein